jgi:hypothetical protein
MTTKLVTESIYNEDCKEILDLILPIQQIEFNVPITLEGQPDLLDIEKNYHQTGGENVYYHLHSGEAILPQRGVLNKLMPRE